MITPHRSRELLKSRPSSAVAQRRLGAVATLLTVTAGLAGAVGLARFAAGYAASASLPYGVAAAGTAAAIALHAAQQRWVAGARSAVFVLLALLAASLWPGAGPVRPLSAETLAFGLVAVSLLALSTDRLGRVGLSVAVGAAIAAVTLGANALAVRAIGIPVAFGWGRWSQLAPSAAALVCAIALGVLTSALRTGLAEGLMVRRWLPALATASVVGATLVMWQVILEHDRGVAEGAVRRQAHAMASELSRATLDRGRLLQRLATRWANDRVHAPDVWSLIVREFARDSPGMEGLGWADGTTRLQWTAPTKAVAFVAAGSRLDADPRSAGPTRRSAEQHATMVSVPMRDREGRSVSLLVVPVARAGQTVGYLTSGLATAAFVDGILGEDLTRDYAFRVYDGDVLLHRRDRQRMAAPERWEVRVPVEAMGRRWELRVVPTESVLAGVSSQVPVAFLAGGLLLAGLLGWIVFIAQGSRELSSKLADLVNELAEENAARRQSQHMQSALVHSTLDGVAAFDGAGCVSAWNPRMVLLTGRAEADVDGQMVGGMLPFLPPGTEVPLLVDALEGLGTQLPDIHATVPSTGEEIWLDISVTPMRSEDGRTLGGLLVARDVTERKRVADLILAGKLAAEEANHSKSNFLARMSHELRTPLNAVIGFTNVMRRNAHGRLERDELTYLERINANGRHLLGLINEVLDLAKVESGHAVAELAPTSLSSLVRETVADLDVRASGASVRLLLDLPAGPLELHTDGPKLKQVLINLIGNAIKFTPAAGQVTVRVRIDAGSGQPTRIEVEDTGIGIPADRHGAIFEAFEQVDADTARRFGGTGLGLAISQKLCSLLGHDLVVQSQLGIGSTFSVIFPTPDAEQAAA